MADQGKDKNEIFVKPTDVRGGLVDDVILSPVFLKDIVHSTVFRNIAINTENDFPDPVAGVITLENNINYIISQPLVILNSRLLIPENGQVKLSGDIPGSVLYYTGYDALISGDSVDILNVQDSTWVAPLGSIFNITGAKNASSFIDCTLSVFNSANLGVVHEVSFFMINSIYSGFSQGIEMKNNPVSAHINVNILGTANALGCVYVTYKGTIPFITVNSMALTSFGANETLFDIDPGLLTVSGYFTAIVAAGLGTAFKAGSLDQTFGPLKFNACVNIADSTIKGQAFLDNNALTTDIPDQNAWVIINGSTDYNFRSTERMQGISDGGLKYIGNEDFTAHLSANINLSPVLATKSLESCFIVIRNGLLDVTFTNATNLINRLGHDLENGDTISFKNTQGTLPVELRTDVLYYVVNTALNTFQVSYTLGGAVVTFTDDGTPINNYSITGSCNGIGRAEITSFNPVDIIPQSIVDLRKNDQIYVIVRNSQDSVDINVKFVYFSLVK